MKNTIPSTLTEFMTAEGQIIYRTANRIDASNRAINKAIKQGRKTLFAVEPDGKRFDYTDLLNRYAKGSNDLL